MFPGPRSVCAAARPARVMHPNHGRHCRSGDRRWHWQDGSRLVPLPCLQKRPGLRTWPLPCPGSRAISTQLAPIPQVRPPLVPGAPRQRPAAHRGILSRATGGNPSQTPAQAHTEHREVLLFRKHLSIHSAHHRCHEQLGEAPCPWRFSESLEPPSPPRPLKITTFFTRCPTLAPQQVPPCSYPIHRLPSGPGRRRAARAAAPCGSPPSAGRCCRRSGRRCRTPGR